MPRGSVKSASALRRQCRQSFACLGPGGRWHRAFVGTVRSADQGPTSSLDYTNTPGIEVLTRCAEETAIRRCLGDRGGASRRPLAVGTKPSSWRGAVHSGEAIAPGNLINTLTEVCRSEGADFASGGLSGSECKRRSVRRVAPAACSVGRQVGWAVDQSKLGRIV